MTGITGGVLITCPGNFHFRFGTVLATTYQFCLILKIDKMDYIKKILLILTVLVSLGAFSQTKKNVLFIAVDDLKPLLNCYGRFHLSLYLLCTPVWR